MPLAVASYAGLCSLFIHVGQPGHLTGVRATDQCEQRPTTFPDISESAINPDGDVNGIEWLEHNFSLALGGHERNRPRTDERHKRLFSLMVVERRAIAVLTLNHPEIKAVGWQPDVGL